MAYFASYKLATHCPLAQSAEHPAVNRNVVGSSPTGAACDFHGFHGDRNKSANNGRRTPEFAALYEEQFEWGGIHNPRICGVGFSAKSVPKGTALLDLNQPLDPVEPHAWTVSSVGRAPALQAGSHRFKSGTVHFGVRGFGISPL